MNMDNNKDEKILLTLKEAANYFGIGINTLRRLTNKHTNLCIFNVKDQPWKSGYLIIMFLIVR